MGWLDARIGQALGSDRYHGMAFGWIFLVLLGVINLGRGSIHVFRSDGGASSIVVAAAFFSATRRRVGT